MSRIDLNVPFEEHGQASALGARWDSAKKAWYIPPGVDVMKFARWHPVIAEWHNVLDEKGRLTAKGTRKAKRMQNWPNKRTKPKKQRRKARRKYQQAAAVNDQ
jgi:hypothetical protein